MRSEYPGADENAANGGYARFNVKPSVIVNHRIPIASAPDAYRRFDARERGYTKVLIKPQLAAKVSPIGTRCARAHRW
ncbi:MAG: hypothetical protein NVSMB59_21110 [Vulcanimicrobiaceae bacterium]